MLCLCLLFLLPQPLSARAESEVLRVSFNPLPPWKVIDDNGTPDGIDIAFLHLLAERMNLKVEFVHLPFKRGLKTLEYGGIDLMIGVLRRPDREVYAHFLTPAYKSRTNKAFYVLKGKEDSITEYEDLRPLVVGTQLGGKYFPRFDNDAGIRKAEVKDTEFNIRMLLAGRIDTFITTEVVGDYRLARLGMTDRIAKARYVYCKQQDVHMILSRKSPLAPRLAEFNTVIRDLVEHGEFERIEERFLSSGTH